jgi:hypothetical protein
VGDVKQTDGRISLNEQCYGEWNPPCHFEEECLEQIEVGNINQYQGRSVGDLAVIQTNGFDDKLDLHTQHI